ncbi:MAG: hypothetical protein KDD39_08035 [Bdellovibrionales bacterium]|nr:hypothetical protein [Bdellovibrionales bacterium]
MRARRLSFLLFLIGLCICFPKTGVAAGADPESVRVEVLTCELVFARDAAEKAVVVYKPHSVDIQLRSVLSMGGEPFEIDSAVSDIALMEVWLAFYPEEGGVRVRWWSGVGDEYIEFPTSFESGDWASLENGSAVLLAPEDVTRRIGYSGPSTSPVDIAKFLAMDGLLQVEAETGMQVRMRREKPFRPRFVFNDGRVSVEGLMSTTEVTVYGPDPGSEP